MGARTASAAGQDRDGTGARRVPPELGERVDALWLATLQSLFGRAAHDVRGALNAVAVNLEVARSRSEKPDLPASALAPYVGVASGQLEGVIAMTEALMFLVRSGRGPADIGAETARMVALLAPAARSAGRSIELDQTFGGLGTTSASSSSARLAIGRCLLAAADASANVCCVGDGSGASPTLRLEHGGEAIPIDAAVTDVLATVGIEVQTGPSVIAITFPR